MQDSMGEIKNTAGELVNKASEQSKSQMANQKDRAAGSLQSVASAMRQTGEQLRQKDQDLVANYTEKAADQVDRFSQYLRDQDINQIIDEVQDYARRQPAIFIGGAFALGFLASRFLKSSGQKSRQIQSMNQPGYGFNRRMNATPASSGYYAETGDSGRVGYQPVPGYNPSGSAGRSEEPGGDSESRFSDLSSNQPDLPRGGEAQ